MFATEVLEHLYPHQSKHLQAQLAKSVLKGGVFYTNVKRHDKEFGHVSADLNFWRAWLARHGFTEVVKNVIFKRKSATRL